MLDYVIETGILSDGHKTIHCYSGIGADKNNPASVGLAGRGPIPPGTYSIGPMFVSPQSGRGTMRLTPQAGTNTYGRAGFEMHGDSNSHPGAASHGCICTTAPSGFPDREYVNSLTDRQVHVHARQADLMA